MKNVELKTKKDENLVLECMKNICSYYKKEEKYIKEFIRKIKQ